MDILIAILGAAGVAALLFLAGYHAGQVTADMQVSRRTKAALRVQDETALRRLRTTLETDAGGLNTRDACILYDACLGLGLDDAATQRIIGPAWWLALNAPINMGQEERDGGE